MQDYVFNSEWRTLNITEYILRNNTGTEYLNCNQVHKIKNVPVYQPHAALI